ncbi:MAG: HU family DNA-binding protein [Gammaproteobacteria bacterium]|nr:HU family DNA-binding protein [Gammaproteobacteria bacterium]HEX5635525.1 HU family DNA-binding protein [Gammaproteobacteria bacterium]
MAVKKKAAKKPVAKKPVAKKSPAKKPAAKKSAVKAAPKKVSVAVPSDRAPTKSEILNILAAETTLNRKQVSAVLDSLTDLIGKAIGSRGAGLFALPGLLKVKVIKKPATKARKGINPFTKEEVMFKAKPARKVVKILPLKGIKDMV